MDRILDLVIRLIEYLKGFYLYDIGMFKYLLTHWWNYVALCIPVLAYLCFFVIKWVVLFFPILLPFGRIIYALQRSVSNVISNKITNKFDKK